MTTRLFMGLFLFFAVISTSIAQEVEFLNKYSFRVFDTTAYHYEYFRIIKDTPTSKVTLVFTRDSLKISQTTLLKDENGAGRNELMLSFSENGKLVCNQKKDLLTGEESIKEFYENGKMKSEKLLSGDSIIQEWYFSESGITISKPFVVDPSPKGGMQGWNRYLSLTLRYPIRSRQNNSEGVVFIAFDLNENGEIKNPEVANPEEMDPLLAEEALRALRIYPYKWTPLTIDGVAKRCKRRLPVNFKLTD